MKRLLTILMLSMPMTAMAGEGASEVGILLLAHGGQKGWNDEVNVLAAAVDKATPVEVAFGMASKKSMQDAIERLAKRQVRQIVAVPLFVSSHSSVIQSTEYLLGLRTQPPPELHVYAHMTHGGHDSHGGDATPPGFDPMKPIESPVPIRMARALDASPVVAEILAARAKALSKDPAHETVVVVAHGPVSDEENNAWLADMAQLATAMRGASAFKRVEYLTVRDDAPEPIRSRAAVELRTVVERAAKRGDRVLLVPLLISYGGIEAGIRKRLEGLDYTMSKQGLLPDGRLAEWVKQSGLAK